MYLAGPISHNVYAHIGVNRETKGRAHNWKMASRVTAALNIPTDTRTFPRSNIRTSSEVKRLRNDQLGNSFSGKKQRVTFIDRVKGEPIHSVVEVEAIEYDSYSAKKKGCHCLLF
jgi:hypothetical protein